MAAPCQAPGDAHRFSDRADRPTGPVILTNPDGARAEVDLRFYGRRASGRAGSPGITIPGQSSRTISLSSLVQTRGR
jgi:hypothetical protein